jgi:hypothetical protein
MVRAVLSPAHALSANEHLEQRFDALGAELRRPLLSAHAAHLHGDWVLS